MFCTKENKFTKAERELFNKQLKILKRDLMNGTSNSTGVYGEWLLINRDKLLPSLAKKRICFWLKNKPPIKKKTKAQIKNEKTQAEKKTKLNNHYYRLKVVPQTYLKYMYYMNLELESREKALFQPFPMRTTTIPKYIPIDTRTLIQLLAPKNERARLKALPSSERLHIWDIFLKTDHNIFNSRYITFDYRLITDGVTASLQFIKKGQETIKETRKLKLQAGRKRKRLQRSATSDQIEVDQPPLEAQPAAAEAVEIEANQSLVSAPVTRKQNQWRYITELDQIALKQITQPGFIVADPGKNNLLYLMSEDGTTLRFTNKEKLTKTKYYEFRNKLQKYRDLSGIAKDEKPLTGLSSKTCTISKFVEYIKTKNEVNLVVAEKYHAQIFRQLKWRGHVNRERYYTQVSNRIISKFGRERSIFYGDYSANHNFKGLIASPGIGLKRKISNRIAIYNLDEYRTSKLNYFDDIECKRFYALDKTGVSRSVHSILMYQTENKRYGCIGRDLNAVRNMVKLVNGHLETGERLKAFSRSKEKSTSLLAKEAVAPVAIAVASRLAISTPLGLSALSDMGATTGSSSSNV